MRGRVKGQSEHIIILAHQVAAMTGQLHSKRGLKGVDHYLKPQSKDQSAAVAGKLKKMEKAGLTVRVKRVKREEGV